MDALLQALGKVIEVVFTKPENVALLFSGSVNVAMGYFIFQMRKEDRADRIAMTDALKTMTDAINNMRVVIAAALRDGDV